MIESFTTSSTDPFNLLFLSYILKGSVDEVVKDSITGHGDAVIHKASSSINILVYSSLTADIPVITLITSPIAATNDITKTHSWRYLYGKVDLYPE